MTDPERLLRTAASPLSRLLLRAGEEEKPSHAALRRTAKAVAVAAVAGTAAKSASAAATAVGVKLAAKSATPALLGSATAATAATTAPMGAALGVGVVVKWVGIGVLSGAIGAPLLQSAVQPQSPKRSRPPAALAVQPRESIPRARPAEELRRAPASVPSVAPEQLQPPPPVEARRALAPSSSAPETPPKLEMTPASKGALLATEVRFVDQGRAALQRGAFQQALELLAPYEERFPQRQLLTEVLFLRMEAFSRSGNDDRARSLAASIVTRGVAGPQAARARAVLGY